MSDKAKHTPGKWRVTGATPADGYEFFEIVANSRYVGTVNGPQDDEGRANAHLIASAPDLLAALDQFVSHYPVGINPYLDDAWKAARAAIKKAKGE